MPGQNVNWPLPLLRLPPWFGGQMGVPGTDWPMGLRNHSSGLVFYVDPNHENATDGQDGTDPIAPLATVAEAITRCRPHRGDVIAVMANNGWQFGNAADGYNIPIREEVILDVPGVRLVGVAPAGTVGVVWEPVTPAGAGTCITVTAIDCLIEGFSFQGGVVGGRALYAEWNGTTAWADNLIVRHCLFDDDIDIAIQLEFVYFGDIHDNWFQECDAAGVYVDAGGSGIAYCAIHDNWLHDPLAALSLAGADKCQVYRNHLYNSLAQAGAACPNAGIFTTGGTENLVFDNWLSCLLPVPANGDYNNFCTASASDAWINNHCLDGDSVTNPI